MIRAWLLGIAAFVVFAISMIWLGQEVQSTLSFQRALRTAESARVSVLTLQLDEETGIRGYASTRSVPFLEPYVNGRAQFPIAMRTLLADLSRVAGRDAGLADAMRNARSFQALHDRWQREVAMPLLAGNANGLALQMRGKELVDRMRTHDAVVHRELQRASDTADDHLRRDLLRLIVPSAVAEAAILALTLLSGMSEQRALRIRSAALSAQALYEGEKRLSETLQRALLQHALPSVPNIGFEASYSPAEPQSKVGGDWYDALMVDPDHVFFSIGDVTGHGAAAAVTMSRVRQALIAGAVRDQDPSLVLDWANRTMLLQREPIVTAICGFVNVRTNEICYATAGHPPPVLARPGTAARFLPYEGLPLGVQDGAHYRTLEASGSPGALFVLYTDGLTEYKRDIAQGERRLLRAVEQAVTAKTNDRALMIRKTVFGHDTPVDDVAILVVRFASPEPLKTRRSSVDDRLMEGSARESRRGMR